MFTKAELLAAFQDGALEVHHIISKESSEFKAINFGVLSDFFAPSTDLQNVLVSAETLRKADKPIIGCESCSPDDLELPFDNVLDRVTGSDPYLRITFLANRRNVHVARDRSSEKIAGHGGVIHHGNFRRRLSSTIFSSVSVLTAAHPRATRIVHSRC